MTADALVDQKAFRLESQRVGEVLFVEVESLDVNTNVTVGGYRVTSQLDLFRDLSSNDGAGRIAPHRLLDATIQIFQLRQVFQTTRTVRIAETLADFIVETALV